MIYKYDFLIVGAGLFGATFAHEMIKKGKNCLVIDKRDRVGGNIRCEQYNGVVVHSYGAHIFHTNNRAIWDYVNDKTELTPIVHSPMAKTGDGKLLQLPFCLHTFHGLWEEVNTPQQAKEKIQGQTKKWADKYPTPMNLEQKALCLVGQDIYEALIKGYTEKQWNCQCDKLPAEIITRIPLRYNWQASYFDDAFVGIPARGYNALVDTLLDGADLMLGVDYNKERNSLNGIAEHILYTGCIDEYFGYSLGHLQYRSLRFDTKIEPLENSQGCSVVNYTGKDVAYTRCIEHNQFNPNEFYEELVKSYEYPQDFEVGKTEPYYPIINEDNKALYKMYSRLAANTNVIFGGRLGMYRYMDMDDAIEAAIKLSKSF